MGQETSKKELQLNFWNVAKPTSIPEMQNQLQSMKNLNGGEKAVEELLGFWPIEGWCQAYFSDVVQCEVIDNNMCETFNGVMLEARNKPIITLLEDIRRYVMHRIVVKRAYAEKWRGNYGPNIVEKIENEVF